MVEVPSRQRARRAQARDIPRERDLAAVTPRAGTEVDDVVGDLDDLGLVLDDEDRVALVAQTQEHLVHALDVVRVQTHRGLVEHVGDVRETRAEVPDHLRALRLAARQRPRRAVERQIAETDLDERVEGLLQPLHEGCDLGIVDRSQPLGEIGDLHGRDIRDVHVADLRRRGRPRSGASRRTPGRS